jgi:hypothetical protein
MKLKLTSLFLLFAISAAFSQEAQGIPLNLSALTARDSENFEDYSIRHALIGDSIFAIHKSIEAAKKKAEAELPPIKPKDEFEKQAEYDARVSKWNAEISARTEKDTKALKARLAELEKAKAKVIENQASLYASVEIKSEPLADAWINGEAMATPIEYKSLVPGTVKIRLQKEGYNPWDSTLQVPPRAILKLYVVLEEKSIFSQENEINFSKILSKDTTVDGYKARIKRIKARKTEVGKEIKQILENFQKNYPILEPQKNGETPSEFEKRREEHEKEVARQFVELQKKNDVYNRKLTYSIAVLDDYIVATQSSLLASIAATANIKLGAYDSEMETFEFVAQDTANKKSPFYFNGKVGVPLNTAKNMNRNVPGFIAGLQFINFPFNADSASVNLAMSGLQLSMNGQSLKVSGSFGEIERYKSMEGYNDWKLRADSLLSGTLKAYGLDYAFAMNAAAKDVAKIEDKKTGGRLLGWRGITRITAFSATAILGAASIYKHSESKNRLKELDDLKSQAVNTDKWIKQYSAKADEIKNEEKQRNIYGASAGVCALSGSVTFFF